jgi:hypothetical protein
MYMRIEEWGGGGFSYGLPKKREVGTNNAGNTSLYSVLDMLFFIICRPFSLVRDSVMIVL